MTKIKCFIPAFLALPADVICQESQSTLKDVLSVAFEMPKYEYQSYNDVPHVPIVSAELCVGKKNQAFKKACQTMINNQQQDALMQDFAEGFKNIFKLSINCASVQVHFDRISMHALYFSAKEKSGVHYDFSSIYYVSCWLLLTIIETPKKSNS